ncbi:acetyltransferase [Singulisphaera acidiphila]|uniref:Sugar O-acyltransferase, sialic acid O-acetyltransferase NeuD family n=1 Tax=Singulisphaera acidiphila (strain ATCC BAA-1392 / DSM 18658 / VKM B-2454 / MOB10) TaxID=886293 RepID=L0DD26_SINAD|nr:acetyltransferase [Singulisphaera acidiphila]AGA26765.1 sugar O-acyltransferase, sialic acid O-acetyltransferase NeuD family [Singulisphaera acidiphila DSM 18658]
MSLPLVILGTGGSVYDVLDIIESINAIAPSWEVIGFLDDARPAGTWHLDLEILGPLDEADLMHGHTFVNAIGSDKTFRRLPRILASTGLTADRYPTLVHPAASVSSRARLGQGVTVNYGVSVGGGATIGNHVILCPGCIVGHNTTIGDYSIVAPGAVISGSVQVGRNCYIGASAVLRQQLRIGDGSLIGMGAVVVRDFTAGSIVVGNPARPLPHADFLSFSAVSEARR